MENKIIDYINQTPENTNPSVLATLLGELKTPKPLTYDYMPEGYPTKEQSETIILENQTISGFQESSGVYLSENSVVQEAISNKYPGDRPTIKILWDGTEYECQYIYAATPVNFAYGNSSLLGVGEDTGEPFLILMGEFFIISKTSEESHEVRISATTETITPMAEEFMPVLTSPNGTKYKLTVDDSGAISATEVTL